MRFRNAKNKSYFIKLRVYMKPKPKSKLKENNVQPELWNGPPQTRIKGLLSAVEHSKCYAGEYILRVTFGQKKYTPA